MDTAMRKIEEAWAPAEHRLNLSAARPSSGGKCAALSCGKIAAIDSSGRHGDEEAADMADAAIHPAVANFNAFVRGEFWRILRKEMLVMSAWIMLSMLALLAVEYGMLQWQLSLAESCDEACLASLCEDSVLGLLMAA